MAIRCRKRRARPPTRCARASASSPRSQVSEYGSRVGIYRCIDLFDRFQVNPTIFACALALERNPAVTAEFVQRDYDIVSHGYRWINHFGLTEPEEREQIRKARELFARTINRPVVGWFNRMPQTIATRRILAEEGLLFDSAAVNDDIPYFQEVAGRPFLIVPYSVDVNDFRFWRGTMFTGRDFEIYCRDAFDTLYRESERTPRMLSVGLHSKIIGRPARIGALERFLDTSVNSPMSGSPRAPTSRGSGRSVSRHPAYGIGRADLGQPIRSARIGGQSARSGSGRSGR